MWAGVGFFLGAVTFTVATLIPLFRSEIEPRLFPSETVDTAVQIVSDHTSSIFLRENQSGSIYGYANVLLELRISNLSEFPVTVDGVLMTADWDNLEAIPDDQWASEYVYQAGFGVDYEVISVEVEPGNPGPYNVLRAAIEDERTIEISGVKFPRSQVFSKYRKLVYKIPPYETEYIFLALGPTDSESAEAFGANVAFEIQFVIRGEEGANFVRSPVGFFVGPAPSSVQNRAHKKFLDPELLHSRMWEAHERDSQEMQKN